MTLALTMRQAVAEVVVMASDWREEERGHCLSPAQLRVLRLAAQGCTDREIGRRLGISRYTVAHHLERARARLGACNRAQLTGEALRRGLI